ncbi:glycosyl transferase [Arthrobacter alpinus]|uniref:Glycosyl transferase n=1 Tax=Arthrobacter alpinus TaxID=656366 RepID=A0A0M4QV34_9MICC|nr:MULTISPECIES: glycosyltransferase family A protein [Arthrobacter]ALE91523.1 glycosyl transferase [Arthrobacter alpinus]
MSGGADALMRPVTTIIATRNRPEMLREAIASVVGQSYTGAIEVLVIFDQCEPDMTLQSANPRRIVRVLSNARAPGLAGARNTGIEAASGEFIAFCDDDDYWKSGKIAAQVELLTRNPAAEFSTCDISVNYSGEFHDRQLGKSVITFQDLLRDRHTELHPSTFLMRRDAVVQGFGLVGEDVPGGFGEDYDFLLRVSRRHPIVHVAQTMTVVRWGGQSFFFQRWQTMLEGLSWILAKYPEFETVPAGSARIRGQVAFAHAALGQRKKALRWATSAAQRNPFEPRAPLAIAVAWGLVSPERVMRTLHSRGRGI